MPKDEYHFYEVEALATDPDASTDDLIACKARSEWIIQAHDYQIEPIDYFVYWLNAGRGSGKTKAACQWLWWQCWMAQMARGIVLAPTQGDLRRTCFEGESGLMETIPRELIVSYNKSTHEMKLKNGSMILGFSGESYERLRGANSNFCWVDELGAFQTGYDQQAWAQMMFGLRKGFEPKIFVSTTPRASPQILELFEQAKTDKTIVIQTANTYQNIANLSPSFAAQLKVYEGTPLGRQEIYAELIDQTVSIFLREHFKLYLAEKPLPRYYEIVQAWDCATGKKEWGDYSAMTTFAIFDPRQDPRAPNLTETLSPYRAHILVIDAWRGKVEYADLRDKVAEYANTSYGEDKYHSRKQPDYIVIEDSSNGTALLSDLRRMKADGTIRKRCYIVSENTGGMDKFTRAHLASAILANQRVWLLEDGKDEGKVDHYFDQWLAEVSEFPNGRVPLGEIGRDEPYDDWLDTTSMGLNWMRKVGKVLIDGEPYRLPKNSEERKSWYGE